MPEQVTPFTVLALLQRIGRRAELAGDLQQQLDADIRRIESSHFGRQEDGELDLDAVAREWLRRAC